MKNYISFNIRYLCEKNFLTQKDFGELFSLKQSSIATYLSERSQPNVETLQKISLYFKISIDDFINQPLDQVSNKKNDAKESTRQESEMIKLLQEALNDKQKIILSLEKEIRELKGIDDKSQAV